MQRVKKDEIPAETTIENEGTELQNEEFESLSYVDQINDFISRNNLLEIEAVYYLYKYDGNSGNAKSFIHKYSEIDPPDEDTIGRTFGSGRYLVILAIPKCEKAPKGYMRAYNIKIHSYYDTLKAPQAPTAPAAPTIIQQSSGFNEAFEMIAKIVTIIAPLLQKSQQAPLMPDMSQMLFKTYEATNEVLKKSMTENVKNLGEMQRKILSLENGEMNTETEIDEAEETSLIETLKPLLIEWLPKLIGNSPESKVVQQVVKATPQFKRIISNKAEFKTLVSYLDQQQGKEITDKVLTSLKLKRA
jgi:hypothetical protein